MRIAELAAESDLRSCEQIQREVWDPSESELVGVGQLRAAQHAGGLVAGAWHGDELVGFCYGFPAFRPDSDPPHGLHSHMTAVVPGARGLGVGRALKWFQRRWCLERGISWVEWTFDPLRAANARLNLEHLGAIAGEYLVDAYATMDDALNRGMPSDRLMARWDLLGSAVVELASGGRRAPPGRALPCLQAAESGPRGQLQVEGHDAGEPMLGLREPALSAAVPQDIGRLLQGAPATALAWRLALRTVLVHYFAAGYRATRFGDGGYRLELDDRQQRAG
jgi:chorismate synthase